MGDTETGMVLNVLVAGVSESAAGFLRAAAEAMGDVRVEVVENEAKTLDRLADPRVEVNALLLGPMVENASYVAETSLRVDGRRVVHPLVPLESIADAEQVLRALQSRARAWGERQEVLLSMIAHDVRAPLGVALGALSEMAHPTVGALNEEQQKLLVLAKRSLDRIVKLSSNISQLARIDARRLTLTRAPADLGVIAHEVTRRVLRDEPERASLRMTLETSSVIAEVDREKIALAVDNVMSNAIRFARQSVCIKTLEQGALALVVVEDDGPGLPAGVVDIFDRIQLASKGTGKTGSGLGLAVVRGIMRAHGGDARAETIEVEGTARGARFTLSLPRRL
jgi:signal transduction histidine kinase